MLTLIAQTGIKLNISQAISGLPDNPFKYTDLGVFLSNVIGVAIIGAALFALFYLLWGAFEWIVSGGDKGALENARNKIMAAIVGLILVVAVWGIFSLVQYFLGINLIKTTNPGGYYGGSSYSGGGGGGGGGGSKSSGLRCPGPNCDRCPGSTSRTDWVTCNSSEWRKNAQCASLYPAYSFDCTKN